MRIDKLTPNTFFYRGAKVPLKIFEDYKDILNKKKGLYKKYLQIKGFTSTTLKKEEAFKYIFKGLRNDDVPVLYQIRNQKEDGHYYFHLDSEEYSLFPYEQEVLFISDSWFKIIEISE